MDTKEFLITEYKDYIYSIAKLFYGIDKEDLFQAGAEGLIESFYSYDDTSNVKFTTYAYKNVYGHMYALIAKSNDVKISKDTWKLYRLIMQTYQQMTQEENKMPSMSEVARRLNITDEILNATIMACQKASSLDATNEESKSYIETIPSKQELNIDDKIFLEQSMETLTPLEKEIINYRYFADLTQSEVAQKLGLSQVKVSRSEKSSLNKLRSYVKECV